MNLENKIIETISKNAFIELENLLTKYKPEEYKDILIKIAFDNDSLVIYTAICMLLIKKETSTLHWLAAKTLSHPLCHVEGAYAAALYHTRKALSLSPKDIAHQEALLFFNRIPEKLVSNEEAKKIAQEILKVKPDSSAAKHVLDSTEN